MADFLLAHETVLRGVVFALVLVVFTVAEALLPRRSRRIPRRRRWPANLGLALLGTIAIRLLGPLVAVGVAAHVEAARFGLLQWLALPAWLALLLAILALDLVIYAQHVAFHRVPVLWRIHRMHHSDLELDATSGVRFHPFEYALSMLVKSAAVVLLGIAPAAVVAFEILLNATAIFNHANLRLAPGLDRWLRRLVVTPDFHIVHHSVRPDEHNRNFGFNLSWWDHLFGTYRARPEKGPVALDIGLAPWRDPAALTLTALLRMPFAPVPARRGH